jgi:hypothetical protein
MTSPDGDAQRMTQKSPPRQPPTPDPEQARGPHPQEEAEERDAAAAEEAETAPADEVDPYEDLWDPDMDTRPERIRKTKARPRTASRGRGGGPPRGRRRDET